MEKLTLTQQEEQEHLDYKRQASLCFKNEDWEGMKKIMLVAWEKLPEPKFRYSESYWIAYMMCEAALGEKNIPLAEEWINIFKQSALHRIDSGERIFMEARVFYLKQDFDKAKELFHQADQMSKGRLFQNPAYVEYLKFYKQK